MNSKYIYYGPEEESESAAKKTLSQRRRERNQKAEDIVVEEVVEKEEKAETIKMTGRPLMDSVVEAVHTKNPGVDSLYNLKSMNAGRKIDSRLYKVSLSKAGLVSRKIIDDIIAMYNYLKFESDDYYVVINGERFRSNECLVKLIKCCAAGQVNPVSEYSQVIANIYHSLIEFVSTENICLPIKMNGLTDLQQVVLDEFNEFFEQELNRNNISYDIVLETKTKSKKSKSKKSKKDDLLEGASIIQEV